MHGSIIDVTAQHCICTIATPDTIVSRLLQLLMWLRYDIGGRRLGLMGWPPMVYDAPATSAAGTKEAGWEPKEAGYVGT